MKTQIRLALVFVILFAFAAAPHAARADPVRWHHGEEKWLDVGIKFYNYQGITQNGIPYYYKDDDILYTVRIKNTGNRWFNRFQARTMIETLDGELIYLTEWQPSSMAPGEVLYLGLQVYQNADIDEYSVWVDIRHTNQSGQEVTASFSILDPGFFIVINPDVIK